MDSRTLSELRAGAALRVGSVTIVPLERRSGSVACDGGRVSASGGLRAEALVIVDAAGTRALDDTGAPLDLDALRERLPALGELL